MKRNISPEQRARKQAMKRKWDANNPEKVKTMNYLAYKNKPEMFINNASKRYAKIKNVDRRLIRACEIKALQSKPCLYCGSTKQIEIDHIIPIARGGRHSIGNLAPACRACNRSKTDYLVMEWRRKRGNPPVPTHTEGLPV
jgi:5-methylcytosine-specific restriction endonuclease McrA